MEGVIKLYRLKKEARPFFDDRLVDEIKPMWFWENSGVSENALDEVTGFHVTVGHENNNVTYKHSWNRINKPDGEGRIDFSVRFDATNEQYSHIVDKRNIIELCDFLEKAAKNYISNKQTNPLCPE